MTKDEYNHVMLIFKEYEYCLLPLRMKIMECELVEEELSKDSILISYMGCGASANTKVKDLDILDNFLGKFREKYENDSE